MKLPEPEVRRLIKKAQKGSMEARNAVVVGYQWLVGFHANRMWKGKEENRFDFDDMVGWGQFGLIDAIERFNLRKKCKFSTFAGWRIFGTIQQSWRREIRYHERFAAAGCLWKAYDNRFPCLDDAINADELKANVLRAASGFGSRYRRIVDEMLAGGLNQSAFARELGISGPAINVATKIVRRRLLAEMGESLSA